MEMNWMERWGLTPKKEAKGSVVINEDIFPITDISMREGGVVITVLMQGPCNIKGEMRVHCEDGTHFATGQLPEIILERDQQHRIEVKFIMSGQDVGDPESVEWSED
jgi:hypothetical protein